MEWVHNNRTLKERRKELRKNQTPQENKLWNELRNNKLGVKFKRQHSIGGYITDFYCTKYKLIIELDGEIHNTKENKEYDKIRDKYFIELGYKISRIRNVDIEQNIKEVLEKIKNLITLE